MGNLKQCRQDADMKLMSVALQNQNAVDSIVRQTRSTRIFILFIKKDNRALWKIVQIKGA